MSIKTIFIAIISILVTIILMKNTDEVNFWIFGDERIPKLMILGFIFALGLIVGFLLGRPRKKQPLAEDLSDTHSGNFQDSNEPIVRNRNYLSDEDRDYIK